MCQDHQRILLDDDSEFVVRKALVELAAIPVNDIAERNGDVAKGNGDVAADIGIFRSFQDTSLSSCCVELWVETTLFSPV